MNNLHFNIYLKIDRQILCDLNTEKGKCLGKKTYHENKKKSIWDDWFWKLKLFLFCEWSVDMFYRFSINGMRI